MKKNIESPAHGEQRNYRMESRQDEICLTAPDSEKVTVRYTSSEYSASERYCATCKAWVTAKGVLGGMYCQECGTLWSEKSSY